MSSPKMEQKNIDMAFVTKWGLIFALIGNVVGAGNIWRFPRMAALNGGGAFVLAWTICLLVFSIPLMQCEHIMGRSTRQAPPGAFRDFAGKKFAWFGMFLTCCGFGIGCYYAVICGWSIRYLLGAITGDIFVNSELVWENFVSTPGLQVLFQFISMAIAWYFLYRGVSKGIEFISKIMIPMLFFMLVAMAIYSITLPNSILGLKYLFEIQPEYLLKSSTWLQALSQSAWSVGPGWGLTLAYAAYIKQREEPSFLPVIQGFGDNSAALLAGVTIIIIVFSFSSSVAVANETMAAGNVGLAFVALPKLFSTIPGGRIVGIMFFTAFLFGAITSLMAMMEVLICTLCKWGWQRKKAVCFTCGLGFIIGLPSAISIKFLNNQDWVFGVALLFGCLFTALAMTKFGTKKARERFINTSFSHLKFGVWWDFCIKFVVPIFFLGVFIWWIAQSISWYPDTWWHPFAESSAGTIIFQISILVAVLLIFNNKIAEAVKHKYFNGEDYPPIPKE